MFVGLALHLCSMLPWTIFVWFGVDCKSILLNLQVRRLGSHWPEMAGGTPNYAARLEALACSGPLRGAQIRWMGNGSSNVRDHPHRPNQDEPRTPGYCLSGNNPQNWILRSFYCGV